MKCKNYIINTFRHFKKVCTHKRWVFYYCCKVGIPFQGLVHDLSKLSPTEFWESVKYYQGTSSPIDACKKENGWSAAWMHHKGRNKHHYEYWQDNFDKDSNKTISKEEYEDLLDRDRKLSALEAGGVDNWKWYGESLAQYYNEE